VLDCGNGGIARARDQIRSLTVLYGGRQTVDDSSRVVIRREPGCVTTLATGVPVRAIRHLNHCER
jgi:hypothetical protein